MRRDSTFEPEVNKCAIGERPKKYEFQENSTHSLLGAYGNCIDIGNSLYRWYT
jgi:hypothetical protein